MANIVFCIPGVVLVTGSDDKVVIWDLNAMEMRYKISGHGDTINSIQLRVSLQGSTPRLLVARHCHGGPSLSWWHEVVPRWFPLTFFEFLVESQPSASLLFTTHSHSLSLTLTDSLSLTLTHSHSLSLALTRSHSLSLTLTHSHSLSKTRLLFSSKER